MSVDGTGWTDDPIGRLLPESSVQSLLDEPDVLRVGHGPLQRMPGLAELAAHGSVEAVLNRAPHAIVSAWNIDWNIRSTDDADRSGLDLRLDGATALKFLARGAMLYVDHIEAEFPELAPARDAIETALGLPRDRCKLELVASIGGTGAAMHFDPDYAFNVQLLGRKRWRAAPNANVRHPLLGATVHDVPADVRRQAFAPQFPARMPPDAQTFETGPGSVVWVPRGWWHETEVIDDGESLSLCFALKTPTIAQDLVERMQRSLARDARWRQPLFGSAGSLEQRRAYASQLQALLDELWAEPMPQVTDRLLYDLPAAWADATLSPIDGASAELRELDGGVALVIDTPARTTEVRLQGDAASLAPVARWLCDQRSPFFAVDAAAWAERADRLGDQPAPFIVDDVLGLLDGCVQAGLLKRGGQ